MESMIRRIRRREAKAMLFHEVYSSYYQAVGKLIAASASGELNDQKAAEIIGSSAFSESFVYIMDTVKTGQWTVLGSDWTSPLGECPQRPMTRLERRWLAGIVNDPRFSLFCPQEGEDSWVARLRRGLAGVEPLYEAKDFSVVDGVFQSDPYDDAEYQKNFRTVILALRERRPLVMAFRSGKGKLCRGRFVPIKLEYSEKEDRFRLLARRGRASFVINLARILNCTALWKEEKGNESAQQVGGNGPKATVELELWDQRGALERAMVQFADLEKVTKQIDHRRYTIRLTYRKSDETEILIRILAFGPMIRVMGPGSFIKLVRERLERQRVLENH